MTSHLHEFHCYPKGTFEFHCYSNMANAEATDDVGLFVNVIHYGRAGDNNDNGAGNRKVCVCMIYNDQCWQLLDTVDDLMDGKGFTDIMTIDELKDNPNIEINIKLFGDPLFVSKEDMDMPT
eukprot:172083_1